MLIWKHATRANTRMLTDDTAKAWLRMPEHRASRPMAARAECPKEKDTPRPLLKPSLIKLCSDKNRCRAEERIHGLVIIARDTICHSNHCSGIDRRILASKYSTS